MRAFLASAVAALLLLLASPAFAFGDITPDNSPCDAWCNIWTGVTKTSPAPAATPTQAATPTATDDHTIVSAKRVRKSNLHKLLHTHPVAVAPKQTPAKPQITHASAKPQIAQAPAKPQIAQEPSAVSAMSPAPASAEPASAEVHAPEPVAPPPTLAAIVTTPSTPAPSATVSKDDFRRLAQALEGQPPATAAADSAVPDAAPEPPREHDVASEAPREAVAAGIFTGGGHIPFWLVALAALTASGLVSLRHRGSKVRVNR